MTRICGFCRQYERCWCRQHERRTAYNRVACDAYDEDQDAIEAARQKAEQERDRLRTLITRHYPTIAGAAAAFDSPVWQQMAREFAAVIRQPDAAGGRTWHDSMPQGVIGHARDNRASTAPQNGSGEEGQHA